MSRLKLHIGVYSLEGRQLLEEVHIVDALANNITPLAITHIEPLIREYGMVLVTLKLRDFQGRLYSDNTYWQGVDDAAHQKLNELPAQRLSLSAASTLVADERVVAVLLENDGKVPVLAAKLTLVDHMGARILPARYSDNYLTLLPGEARRVLISYPAKLGPRATVNLRGWNARAGSVKVREAGGQPPQSLLPIEPAHGEKSAAIELTRQ